MDSKALRLSIAAIISTIVLIAVVVYAANIDRINDLLGKKTDGTENEEVLETAEDSGSTVYGEQIGDNLKGFLTADDFFDKSEQRPSVVVVVDNIPVPANASSEDGTTDLSDVDENDKADEEYSYPDSEPEKKIEDELPLPEDKPLEKPDASSTASSEENKPAETANSASTENTTGAASNESTSNATTADSTANTAGTESTTNAASTESTANEANTSSTESTAGLASTESTSGN